MVLHLRFISREHPQRGEIASNQRLFLGTAPILDLPFGGNGVGDSVEFLMKDQLYWSAPRCIATVGTGAVLRYALLKGSTRTAGVVGAIPATQNVNKGTQN